jgi:hypothetical protein
MTVRLAALTAVAVVASLDATPSRRGTVAIGRSVSGRPIIAIERGDPDNPKKALVVGCIHGNERAGIAIAKYLLRSKLPAQIDLWIIPSLNPDGVARRTRGNARGVDLNRNFPFRWCRLGGAFDSGPRPLSEPEGRSAYRLIGASVRRCRSGSTSTSTSSTSPAATSASSGASPRWPACGCSALHPGREVSRDGRITSSPERRHPSSSCRPVPSLRRPSAGSAAPRSPSQPAASSRR